jgi:putative hydrolase of the HAD superfamily
MALISFDLDGVLQRNPFRSDRPDGVFGHMRRLLAPHLGIEDPEAASAAALDLINGEYKARLLAGKLVDAHDWDGVMTTVADRLGQTLPINVGDLVAQCCTVPGLAYAYDGAAETLDRLLADRHTLVSITNGFRAYQEPVLAYLNILDRFTALITPEGVGAAKPEEAIFRAAERYGEPCIHIGDTLPHDVAGAKRVGWKAIYIVQMGAPGSTELPPELAALPPWERPTAGIDWLAFRLEREKRWYPYPPTTLGACTPDAIVSHLSEIPDAVPRLV